mmetsp:Transcript_27644/g.64467  ORF Transcript_27644/g.64467 Transcript_27644/m.64467 type:complete len:217 (-) Transcript_27644:325-975(-)
MESTTGLIRIDAPAHRKATCLAEQDALAIRILDGLEIREAGLGQVHSFPDGLGEALVHRDQPAKIFTLERHAPAPAKVLWLQPQPHFCSLELELDPDNHKLAVLVAGILDHLPMLEPADTAADVIADVEPCIGCIMSGASRVAKSQAQLLVDRLLLLLARLVLRSAQAELRLKFCLGIVLCLDSGAPPEGLPTVPSLRLHLLLGGGKEFTVPLERQ